MSGTLSWSCVLRRGSKYKGTKISLAGDPYPRRSTGAIFVQRPASQFPKCLLTSYFAIQGRHITPVPCRYIGDIVLVLSIARTRAAARLCFCLCLFRGPLSRLNPPDCDRGLEPVCNFDEFSSPCCKTRPNASFASAAAVCCLQVEEIAREYTRDITVCDLLSFQKNTKITDAYTISRLYSLCSYHTGMRINLKTYNECNA